MGKPTPEKVINQLDNGDYASAVKVFEGLTQEEKNNLLKNFKEEAIKIKAKFVNEEMNKTQALDSLAQIRLVIGLEQTVDAYIADIEKIEGSKASYTEAKNAEEVNDTIKAIELYSKVTQEDINHYDIAQSKISELSKKIEDTIPVKIAGTGLDRNIIDNQILNVKFHNNSKKPTKEIHFIVFAYDKNNLPVKVNFGYDDYLGCNFDIPLQPDETSSSDWTWDLNPKGNEVAKVVVILNKVLFFEGDDWTNPSISASIEKYSGKILE